MLKDFIKYYKDDTEYIKHLKIFIKSLMNFNEIDTESDDNILEINQFIDVKQQGKVIEFIT